jgi:glycosyltransferase involved in cell wall biosynthesis
MVPEASPRVTVTIPTYNRADLLVNTIRSVLDQSLSDIEVFVSDNASTDNTEGAVTGIDDPRLHYTRNDTNIGVHGNLSRSLRLGSAPFVTVLPDDDLMLPGCLERKVAILEEHPDVGIVHSASRLVHVSPENDILRTHDVYTGGREDAIEPARSILKRMLSEDYWINFPGTLIRRSAIGDVRFEPADGMADDLGVFLRLARRVQAIAYIAEPLLDLRMHEEAHSTRMGFHELQAGEYHASFIAISHIKRARRRFFTEYGSEFPDIKEIKANSQRWLRKMLLRIVDRKSLEVASTMDRLQLLREASVIEPTVLMTPRAIRFLGKTLARPFGRKPRATSPASTRGSDRDK